MRKTIAVLLTAALLTGCSNATAVATETAAATAAASTAAATAAAESTAQATATSAADIATQCIIFSFTNEGNKNDKVVLTAFASTDEIVKLTDFSILSDALASKQSVDLSDSIDNPFQYSTLDTKGKYVGYEMFTTTGKSVDEIKSMVSGLSFTLGAKNERQIPDVKVTDFVTIDDTPMSEAPLNTTTKLDYTVQDGKRMYTMNAYDVTVTFSVPDDVGDGIYAAQTGRNVCLYYPNSVDAKDPQVIECYNVNKGASASGTCCDTGWFESDPTVEFDNGVRISSILGTLSMDLTADEDIKQYDALSARMPLITFISAK